MTIKKCRIVRYQADLIEMFDRCVRDDQRQIFAVRFIKADGTPRKITVKPGVSYVPRDGAKRRKVRRKAWYRLVREFNPPQWRTVDTWNIDELTVCGITYMTVERWLSQNWGSPRPTRSWGSN